MTTHREGDGSLRDQIHTAAGQASVVPERADVMARALFALRFADRWLAEQVEERELSMRGASDQLRQRYTLTGQNVEIVVEMGMERRLTGAVEPPNEGWVLVRAGSFRDLVRIDEDGMFSSTVPADAGPIDVVFEFDHGLTMTMKDIGA